MSPFVLPTFISRQVLDGRYWFLNLQPDNPEPTTAVCGGYEAVRRDYDIQRRGFPFRTVELVVGGIGTVELGQQSYPLAAGKSYAFGPTVPHRIRTDPQQSLRKYFLCFSGQAAEELLQSGPLADGCPVWVTGLNPLIDLFELLQENGSREGQAVPICNRLVEVILLKFAEVARTLDNLPDRGAADTFYSIRRYLRTEFLNIPSVEQAARRFGVSSAYLARLFRRFEQTTPHSFLARLKLTHAASVLMNTHCRVKDVADQLGYSDQFHFSRAFKAMFGISPREFLAQIRPQQRSPIPHRE